MMEFSDDQNQWFNNKYKPGIRAYFDKVVDNNGGLRINL